LAGLGVGLLLADRQRTERLGQELERADPHRDLTHAGPEESPLHTDPIADVQERDELVRRLANVVLANVALDATGPVGEVGEGRVPVLRRETSRPARRTVDASPSSSNVPACSAASNSDLAVAASRVTSKRYAKGSIPRS